MKNFLVTCGEIALGVFIAATLIIGGLKVSASSANSHNTETMTQASTW